MKYSALIVDDDAQAATSLARALGCCLEQGEIFCANTLASGLELARRHKPNVCVIDLSLDQVLGVQSGFALLEGLLVNDNSARVIVLTGHGSLEHGVRALKLGAANFIEKPADIAHLAALVRDGVNQSELRRSFSKVNLNYRDILVDQLRGTSVVVQQLRSELLYASQTNQSVLLLGETGTGKGLCARIIHSCSRRSRSRLVRWQPSFASSDLVNSELFGHAKGAFTGATYDRRGLIQEANNGTLFLDEIEELPLETQVTLLGVLQERTFRQVGSNSDMDVDFRLICASNCEAAKLIEAGKLRRDFFHRVAHLTIELPALRNRPEDLELLVEAILHKMCDREQINVYSLDPSALDLLRSYTWPGNVRELESVIEGAVYRAQFDSRSVISSEDIRLGSNSSTSVDVSFSKQVEDYKRSLIQEALLRNSGNQAQAARQLQLDRSTLRRIVERS